MYNEETNIEGVLRRAAQYCEDTLTDWELLVIDDGSTDRSATIVKGLASELPQVRLVGHEVNRGMGAGMHTGITNARKDVFVFFPADGQVAVTELDKMLPLLSHSDVVLTTYSNHRELIRRIVSDGLRIFMRVAVGINFELQGLYLFPTMLGRRLAPQVGASTFFFSFELIHLAIETGSVVNSTQIICLPRTQGESKVFNLRRIQRVTSEVLSYARRRARS